MERILFILSLLLYIFAPAIYSFNYCLLSACIFFVGFFCIFGCDKSEKVGFNLLFSIAFFSANYIYPLFVYPVFPNFAIFSYEINYNIISKATSLATLGYVSYVVGYKYQFKKKRYKSSNNVLFNLNLLKNSQLRMVIFLEVLLLLLFVGVGGLQMFSEMYNSTGQNSLNPIVSFIYLIFYNFTLFATIANLGIKNKKLYIIILLICVLLFSTGTRTLPIVIVSVIFCWYCREFKLTYKRIGLYMFAGFVLLSAIGQLRGASGASQPGVEELGAVSFLQDFIVVTRNLYDIYDHVDKNGITYGVSELGYILSVFPFAQSIAIFLFNLQAYELRSETLTSFWLFGKDMPVGLGTNIVGDVYLAFGFIGILLLFFFLGRFVVYSREKANSGVWQYYIVYYVLISGAIFMCRGSFFYSLKNIVWTIVFAYLFQRYFGHRKCLD